MIMILWLTVDLLYLLSQGTVLDRAIEIGLVMVLGQKIVPTKGIDLVQETALDLDHPIMVLEALEALEAVEMVLEIVLTTVETADRKVDLLIDRSVTKTEMIVMIQSHQEVTIIKVEDT